MHQVGGEPFVHTAHPLIPDSKEEIRSINEVFRRINSLDNLLDAVHRALVLARGVLQPGPDHLVGVGGEGGHQLGDGGECEVQSRGDGGVYGLQVTLLTMFLKITILEHTFFL